MMQDLLAMLRAGGTDAGARFYLNVAPDAVDRPYGVCQRVFFNSENVLSGSSGLNNSRVQIDVYGATYAAVDALSSQVDALMSAWPVQNVSIGGQDLYEPEVKLHRVQVDYSIWHA